MTGPVPGRGDATSTARWRQVQDAFAAVLECDPDQRAGVLDSRCADDDDLRREVESLLAAHAEDGLVDLLAADIAPATTWARTRVSGLEGTRINQYVVLHLLGAGGMGLVYKAHDDRLNRHVALKVPPQHLSADAAARQRFLVEARAAAALDHPNVCTILEIGGTGDGQPFIVMPLYDGQTLQARLARGRLSFEEAAHVASQIARGLGCAHAAGVVHRDVKPSNVMLLPDGTVKILDFGIATSGQVSSYVQHPPFGTLAYMSPERVRGSPGDHRGDIWSLGVVLHEMLTATRPFGGANRSSMANAILTLDPDLTATLPPDVPRGVHDVIRRALAKPPEQRYPSMTSLAADLATLVSAEQASLGTRASAPPATPRTPPAGDRRRAAVLVTAVSNYGELVEHLAAADAQQLVLRVRDLAVDVVRRHGGVVNQAIGEEVVSIFGVPGAHEDDELRAVRAALELHARVDELAAGQSSGARLQIRSGIDVGPVVAQRLNEGPRRYAIIGAAAQVATRLVTLATAGGVVLSPECRRLVAPFFHTVPCPPFALDPQTEPIVPFRVTGETGLETRLEAAERSGLTPYVGRGSELALVERHVEQARAGRGGLVAIAGEAGVGKSRLLHELREHVVPAGDVRFLSGRCRAYGDAAPYFPLMQVVRDALDIRMPGSADSRVIVTRVRAIDTGLEAFLPLYLHLLSVASDSHPLPRYLQGEHLQAALLDALAALIGSLASRATVVILFEDWHWADAASRDALERLTEMVAAHRLLLVVTSRPEPRDLDEWPAHATRIELEPLDFGGSAAIMQAVLRVDRVSDDLAQRVFERTGGNPLFLEQVCCALVEQRRVAARAGEAVIEGTPHALALPDTVQAVIRTRLDTLEPEALDVLRAASVIGREFELPLLADVLGPEVDLAPTIVRLTRAGLIQQTAVSVSTYRFTHVLTQEVSYESLLEYQRRSRHEAIGRAIERHHRTRLDDQAALLAHHFSRAEAWREAVMYGRRAANRATALSQFVDALAMLDQVLAWLAHLPDDRVHADLKADLLLQQERECETLGLRGRQREIIGNLIAHLTPRGPSARLAEAYLREGDLLTLLKRFGAADRALSTALRVCREWGDAALERNTLRSIGLLRWHEGRHAEAIAITEHALLIDRHCGDELAVAGDLTNLGSILKSMGRHAEAVPRLEEALALPSLARDPKKLAYALHNLANVHRGLGRLDSALDCLRRANEISRANLLPIQRSFHLTSIAHIDLQQGRIDSALRTYDEAVALSRRARHATGLAQSLRALGEVLFGLGHHDRALLHLREAAALFAQLEDRESEADMWSRVAAVQETLSPGDARDAWRTACALRQHLEDPHGELEALEGIARCTRRLGHTPEESISAFETALALASTLGDTRRQLAFRNVLGILEWQRGGHAEALRHYEAALVQVRALGDRVHEGVVLNGLGATLSRLNRPEEARTALEESLGVNRETGQHLLEAHALSVLGQLSRAEQRLDRAVRYFEQSRDLRRAACDTTGEAWMLRRIAETLAALGDEPGAREAAASAARLAADTGDRDVIAACDAPLLPRPSGDHDATLRH